MPVLPGAVSESWHVTETFHMVQTSRRLIRLPAVLEQIGLGRTQTYELIKKGQFPRQISLSENGRAVAWNSDDIDAWIASRIRAAGDLA